MPTLVRGRDHEVVRDGAFAVFVGQLSRSTGHVVTDHRTSWVRRLPHGSGSFYVKVYEYETWWSRLRGFCRWTGPWARSRAAAEFDALTWMRNHGIEAPEPIFASERRHLGWLVRATLVTAAFAGEPADAWLVRLPAPDRAELAAAIGRLVGHLHALGFRDRNLDLRNLLARREANGSWTVAKIDSPRHRLRQPGRRDDRWARADWARLLPQLEPYGLAATAQAAATAR